MGSFWNELLATSDTMSNVNIVCSDGVIASHKIIVASASDFIKNIIISIPIGDDVTIFLPDFGKEKVEEFLSFNCLIKKEMDIFVTTVDETLNMETKYFEIPTDIDGNFFDVMNHSPPQKDFTTEECDIFKDDISSDLLEVKQELETVIPIPMKKTEISRRRRGRKLNVFSVEEEEFMVEKAYQKIENGEEFNPKILREIIEEQIEVLKKVNPDRNFIFDKRNFVCKFSRRHELKQFYKEKRDVLPIMSMKNKIQLNYSCKDLEELEKDLIANPTSKKEKHKNAVILKKIAFEKALAYFKSDECVSVRQAARKYNIDNKTLCTLIKSGKSYQGSGKTTVFTKEEENVIVSRAMEIVNSGRSFDSKDLKQIIAEEVDTMNVNFPGRNIKMSQNYVQNIANKYNLKQFFLKKIR